MYSFLKFVYVENSKKIMAESLAQFAGNIINLFQIKR